MKRLIVAVAILALGPAARAQETSFSQLLSGKDVPLSLKLKELNSDWKRVSTIPIGGQQGGMSDLMNQLMQAGMMSDAGKKGGGGPSDAAGAMLGMSLLGGLFGGGADSKTPSQYTKGQTVDLGGEKFLVAYQLKAEKPNLMQLALESEKQGGKEPDFSKLADSSKISGESAVELYLINMKSIGSLSGIRAFDLAAEIAESQKAGGLMDLMALGAAKEKATAKPTGAATSVPSKRTTSPAKKPGK